MKLKAYLTTLFFLQYSLFSAPSLEIADIIDVGTNPGNSDNMVLQSIGAIDKNNQYLYVINALANGGTDGSLSVINISDPFAMTIAKTLVLPFQSALLPAVLDSKNKYLYTLSTGTDSLSVVDISSPENAFLANGLTFGDTVGSGRPIIDPNDQYLYICNGEAEALITVDISDPLALTSTVLSSPRLIGSALDSNNRYLYVTSVDFPNATLFSIDVFSTPGTPSVADSLSLSDLSSRPIDSIAIDSKNQYLYVSRNSPSLANISVIDISDPTSLNEVGGIDLGMSTVRGVTISSDDKFLIVTASAGTLSTFAKVDISDPTNPQLDFSLFNAIYVPAVIDSSNKIAYFATRKEGALMALDTSDPIDFSSLASEITNPFISISGGFESGIVPFSPTLDSNNAFAYVVNEQAAVGNGTVTAFRIIQNTSLASISDIKGFRRTNKLTLNNTNIIEWGPADTQGATYFIKRNGALIGTASQNALKFEDPGRPKNSVDTYTIQGSNDEGQSTPISTVTISP